MEGQPRKAAAPRRTPPLESATDLRVLCATKTRKLNRYKMLFVVWLLKEHDLIIVFEKRCILADTQSLR